MEPLRPEVDAKLSYKKNYFKEVFGSFEPFRSWKFEKELI
jgi:hypothetical protein